MSAEHRIVTVRYSSGTHIARCNGVTASCTSDYRAAARALAEKMCGLSARVEFVNAQGGVYRYRLIAPAKGRSS